MSIPKSQNTWKPGDADFFQILDLASNPVAGVDLEGNCLFCNAAFLNMAGLGQADELIGQNLRGVLRPDGEGFRPPFLGDGGHVRGAIFQRADGNRFPAFYEAHSLIRDGLLTGSVVTFSAPLARERSPREKTEGQARQRDAAEKLASRVAHEMNTPIQFLGVNLGFLQKAYEKRMSYGEQGRVTAGGPDVNSDARDLDAEFFDTETPKVLEESLEGLATLARIVESMKGMARDAEAASQTEGSRHAS